MFTQSPPSDRFFPQPSSTQTSKHVQLPHLLPLRHHHFITHHRPWLRLDRNHRRSFRFKRVLLRHRRKREARSHLLGQRQHKPLSRRNLRLLTSGDVFSLRRRRLPLRHHLQHLACLLLEPSRSFSKPRPESFSVQLLLEYRVR
ncbi:BnaA03g18400D [Brassica napus]|uniref:BnaA03g18400D protein n=1 Tax=Brassica napus TaxID=3708 RepID=A0A078F2S3_BRANA|nr:BnaA03g18400D [Brassica napus]